MELVRYGMFALAATLFGSSIAVAGQPALTNTFPSHLGVSALSRSSSSTSTAPTSASASQTTFYSAPYITNIPKFDSTVSASVATYARDAIPKGCTYSLQYSDPYSPHQSGLMDDQGAYGVVAVMTLSGIVEDGSTQDGEPCGGTVGIYATAYPYDPAKKLGTGVQDGGNGACSCEHSFGATGQNIGSTLLGDPIDASTGNKFLQEDDYKVSGWLRFSRFYNSVAAAQSSEIGVQWRHSFDRSLMFVANTGGAANTIVALRPDGKQETFTKNNGSWTGDSDNPDTFVETDDSQGAVTSYVLTVATQRQVESYSSSGLLMKVTDKTGQGITLSYQNNLLSTVTDPNGRQLRFAYSSVGQVSTLTLPDGGSLSYGYDTNGNLTSVKYPDGQIRQYLYNESSFTGGLNIPNALTGVIDETGARYESTTYGQDGATQSTLANGVDNTVITNYGGSASVQYPLGYTASLGFALVNGRYLLNSLDSPCAPQCGSSLAVINYDTNGYPSSYTDFNNNVTVTSYSNGGLLNQEIDAQGSSNQRTINLTWNASLRVPLSRAILDVSGNTVSNTLWTYNALGESLARCDIDPTNSAASGYTCSNTGTIPAGVRRWTYTYCTAVDGTQCPLIGLVLTATGPRTDLTQTTSYSYYLGSSATSCGTPGAACYQPGDLHTVTDALGHVTTIASYDADGRITRLTDPNGVNTDLTYYPRGWLKTRTVGGAQTSFTYMPYGEVQTITDPDGVTTTFSYAAPIASPKSQMRSATISSTHLMPLAIKLASRFMAHRARFTRASAAPSIPWDSLLA